MGLRFYVDGSSDDAPDWTPLTPDQLAANAIRRYLVGLDIPVDHVSDQALLDRVRRMFTPAPRRDLD